MKNKGKRKDIEYSQGGTYLKQCYFLPFKVLTKEQSNK